MRGRKLPSDSQGTDPSVPAPNQRKGGRVTGALKVIVALAILAACSKEADVKARNFDSYPQASRRLEQLVEAHGNDRTIPNEASLDIRESLKGAVPLFKSDVSNRVSRIIEKTGGDYGAEHPEHGGTFTIFSYDNDDGEHVDKFEVSSLSPEGLASSKTLYLTTNQEGKINLLFTDAQEASADSETGEFNERYTLTIEFDNTAVRTHNYHRGAPYDDTQTAERTQFDGDFGEQYDGPALETMYESMQELEAFLIYFEAIATAG